MQELILQKKGVKKHTFNGWNRSSEVLLLSLIHISLGTENRNIDRAEKQDSKESEYQRTEMSAGRTGSEEKNQ